MQVVYAVTHSMVTCVPRGWSSETATVQCVTVLQCIVGTVTQWHIVDSRPAYMAGSTLRQQVNIFLRQRLRDEILA